ncbi:MAG: helix-turn-helix domain-containing protein [Ruminococcus sp.]|nr:helix-turn-helix domain-containing protein [Ruminococcus sp.]
MVKNLKKLRNEKKVTQQQLAEKIGVSQQSVNKYENHNVEPDIETLIKIAEYFHTSVDYLIGNTELERVIENVEKYDLNFDEKCLIDIYRKLDYDERESIVHVMNIYARKK